MCYVPSPHHQAQVQVNKNGKRKEKKKMFDSQEDFREYSVCLLVLLVNHTMYEFVLGNWLNANKKVIFNAEMYL